jgi:glutaredoxin
MSKKNKRQKYCPYCQAKQRTIDRLEIQLRNQEMKKLCP